MAAQKKKELALHSSAAEYLTFVAATGESDVSFEMRYEDENIWLTQKMMAALYDVGLPRSIASSSKPAWADGAQMVFHTLCRGAIYPAHQNCGFRTIHPGSRPSRSDPSF